MATCRSEDLPKVNAVLGWLVIRLTAIHLPSFSANPQDPDAADTIAEFKKKGAIHLDDWDGSPGSLVLGLSRKNSQYLALVMGREPAAKVLQSMKLLRLAYIGVHTERRLRAVCASVFAEKRLWEDDGVWQEAVSLLTRVQLVTEEIDKTNWTTILVIRKDDYFEKVVTDYPESTRPHQLQRAIIQLQKVFGELQDARAMLGVSVALGLLKLYTEALVAIKRLSGNMTWQKGRCIR